MKEEKAKGNSGRWQKSRSFSSLSRQICEDSKKQWVPRLCVSLLYFFVEPNWKNAAFLLYLSLTYFSLS